MTRSHLFSCIWLNSCFGSFFVLPSPSIISVCCSGKLAGYLHPLAILPKWRASSLKLLLCLSGPLYIWDQLGCLVSIVRHQEKSTGFPRGGFACISGHFGILQVFRVAFGCNLCCLLEINPSRKKTSLWSKLLLLHQLPVFAAPETWSLSELYKLKKEWPYRT